MPHFRLQIAAWTAPGHARIPPVLQLDWARNPPETPAGRDLSPPAARHRSRYCLGADERWVTEFFSRASPDLLANRRAPIDFFEFRSRRNLSHQIREFVPHAAMTSFDDGLDGYMLLNGKRAIIGSVQPSTG